MSVKIIYISSAYHNGKEHNSFHRHDDYQILLINKGTILHNIDFQEIQTEAPYASLIFPQQIHRLELSNDAEGYIIQFDESVFCSAILANELQRYNIILYKKLNHVDFKHDADIYDDIIMFTQHIEKLSNKITLPRKMQIKFLVKIAIFKLLDFVSEEAPSGVKDKNLEKFINFEALVNANFKENRKLDFYVKQLGVSRKKLNVVCQHYSGMTPLALIHDKLSLDIKRTFFFEDLSLKEIAYRYSFDSQSALNKFIASKFNCTPSELKSKLTNCPNL